MHLGAAGTWPQRSEARRRLRRLFWTAFALRVIATLVIHLFVSEELFAPDQITYHVGGRFLAHRWSHDAATAAGWVPRGPQAYFYIVAALYWVFGAYSIVPKLMNAFIGAVSVLVVYDLTVRMSGKASTALRAATYVTWFPSLVLWSALNIRDVWIVLLILLICRQALILQDRPGLVSLALLAAGVVTLVQFRAYVLFAVAGPAIMSILVQRSRNVGRALVIGSLALVAVIYADQVAGENRRARVIDLEELNEIRDWNRFGAASSFDRVDISTPGKAVAYLPRGLALFLLAPFPWQLESIRQILALPETLFFYWLIPWMVRGIRHLARSHFRTSLMPLLVTAAMTLGYALGEGNAGTAYRHRAQLLSFFLIYAAVGQAEGRRRPAGGVSSPFARPA